MWHVMKSKTSSLDGSFSPKTVRLLRGAPLSAPWARAVTSFRDAVRPPSLPENTQNRAEPHDAWKYVVNSASRAIIDHSGFGGTGKLSFEQLWIIFWETSTVETLTSVALAG